MKRSHTVRILFEDNDLVVIYKPSGMLSVGYPGFMGKSAEDILKDMYKNRTGISIGAVHRLDRDTSGIMMFACSAKAKAELINNWQKLVHTRMYHCVCERKDTTSMLPDSGLIDAPLVYNRFHVAFVPQKNTPEYKKSEQAITKFTVLKRGDEYDLVACELETGRKNQIRIHMAYLGHPLVGDVRYGSNEHKHKNQLLALHSYKLVFTHPFTRKKYSFEEAHPGFFDVLMNTKKKKNVEHNKKEETYSINESKRFNRKKNSGGSKYIPQKNNI